MCLLNSLLRISGIGIALKKAAPIITEKFQLGVEAQFARMLFAVVALFYVSWTALVVSMPICILFSTEVCGVGTKHSIAHNSVQLRSAVNECMVLGTCSQTGLLRCTMAF